MSYVALEGQLFTVNAAATPSPFPPPLSPPSSQPVSIKPNARNIIASITGPNFLFAIIFSFTLATKYLRLCVEIHKTVISVFRSGGMNSAVFQFRKLQGFMAHNVPAVYDGLAALEMK
ncbi:MAG: hypothetical protein LBC53_10365 [Spirochaetaceae bacterium]|jgi:hypothetical protein|nr:hypothetical protein [Spirochaetaceae bacterium]